MPPATNVQMQLHNQRAANDDLAARAPAATHLVPKTVPSAATREASLVGPLAERSQKAFGFEASMYLCDASMIAAVGMPRWRHPHGVQKRSAMANEIRPDLRLPSLCSEDWGCQ